MFHLILWDSSSFISTRNNRRTDNYWDGDQRHELFRLDAPPFFQGFCLISYLWEYGCDVWSLNSSTPPAIYTSPTSKDSYNVHEVQTWPTAPMNRWRLETLNWDDGKLREDAAFDARRSLEGPWDGCRCPTLMHTTVYCDPPPRVRQWSLSKD